MLHRNDDYGVDAPIASIYCQFAESGLSILQPERLAAVGHLHRIITNPLNELVCHQPRSLFA
jgi:hypothetical protein